jgi:tungstate transport system ATP-binding protein
MDRRVESVTGPACLELRSVSVTQGGVALLSDIDLAIPVDGRTVILGPNGAGKTTLLQAIHGLIPISAGSVRGRSADGDDVTFRFGFVFQRAVMLRRSALANVEHALAIGGVAAAQRRERALRALADVALGYVAHRPARRLSGGEQQRLAVARANALEPDCLLLDEPTANVDPAAGAALERYLLRLSALGRGLVMTTHDLAQARRLAQTVIFMHRGRVEEVARSQDFFDRPQSEFGRRFLDGQWLD